MSGGFVGAVEALAVERKIDGSGRTRDDTAQPQADLGRPRGLPGVAPAEDHVLHALAAKTLHALLTQHPGDGVDDVALAAAVGADNRRDAVIESHVGPIREALEA